MLENTSDQQSQGPPPRPPACPVQGSVLGGAALGGALDTSRLPSSSTHLLLNVGGEGQALSRGRDRQAGRPSL